MVTTRILHEAPSVGRQVEGHVRRFHVQTVEVDEIDVGLVARRQPSAVGQAVQARRPHGLLVHDELDGQPLAANAVATPVREVERRQTDVADDSAVGAAVGAAEVRVRRLHHLEGRVERVVGVVQQREIDQATAIELQQRIVGELFRCAPFALRPLGETLGAVRFVVRRIAEPEHLVPARKIEFRLR